MAEMVNMNFKLDKSTKIGMEKACNAMGLSMSTAFTLFAKKVSGEGRIPFEVSIPDPFYSRNNMNYLKNVYDDYKSGKIETEKHKLI